MRHHPTATVAAGSGQVTYSVVVAGEESGPEAEEIAAIYLDLVGSAHAMAEAVSRAQLVVGE